MITHPKSAVAFCPWGGGAAAQKLGYLKNHMVTHLLNDPPKNTSEQGKLYMCDASDLKSGYLIHQ